MKSKLSFLIVALFLSAFTSISSAQTSIPKGKAMITEFTNLSSKFTVPAGKTWYIVNIFSDCAANLVKSDDLKSLNYSEVRIFIKSINGSTLTDLTINKFGPVVYRGPNHERVHPMPIVLPENSIIEFVITTGDWSSLDQTIKIIKNDKLNAFINIVEIDN